MFSVGDKEVTNGDSKRPPLVRHESITIRRGKEEEPSSPGIYTHTRTPTGFTSGIPAGGNGGG